MGAEKWLAVGTQLLAALVLLGLMVAEYKGWLHLDRPASRDDSRPEWPSEADGAEPEPEPDQE